VKLVDVLKGHWLRNL